MDKKNKIERSIRDFERQRTEIIFSLISCFKWHVENGRIQGFIIGDDKSIEDGTSFEILRLKMHMSQISELSETNEILEGCLSSYCDQETFSIEIWCDDNGPYVEILFADFS